MCSSTLSELLVYFEKIWCLDNSYDGDSWESIVTKPYPSTIPTPAPVADYDSAKRAFDRYLNGEIFEDHPEYKQALDWWSGNTAGSTVRYRSIKQFTSASYRELDAEARRNPSMDRFINVHTLNLNYNRYDSIILANVNYVNDRFSSNIDPNHIKAIAVYETHMGYYDGDIDYDGYIDIMQALDNRAPAVRRLAMEGSYDPFEMSVFTPTDTGYGLFKRLYPNHSYDAGKKTVEMSIMSGTLWYAHKGSFAGYGVGSSYSANVSFVLSTMR